MSAAMRPRANRSGKLFQFLLKYLCLMYLSVDSVPYNEQEMYQKQHTANQQAAALRLIARICRKMKARKAAAKKKQVEPKATDEGELLVQDLVDATKKEATARVGEITGGESSAHSLSTADNTTINVVLLPPRSDFESEVAYEAACMKLKKLEKDSMKLENEDDKSENAISRKTVPPPDPLVSGVMSVAGIPRECRDSQNQHSSHQSADNPNQRHETYLYFNSKGTESEGKRWEAEERTRKLVEQRRALVKS